MMKIFIDEKPDKGGVPRTHQGGWEEELKKLRVSYTGEVIEKASAITLEQILPGLPEPQHGGLVDLIEVVDDKMKKKLLNPQGMLKRDIMGEIPQPKVMCEQEEWERVVLAMHERQLVAPVKAFPKVEGVKVLNGAFGVVKPDKLTDSGKPVLRMIMDLRGSNAVMDQLDGDLSTLTGAACFQKIVVEQDETLLISGDDLTSAFYLFRLPPGWAELLVLERPVPRALFEPGAEGMTYVGVTVLPMGWSSAVAVMQNAHRQLALRCEMNGGAGLKPLAEIRRDAIFPDLEEVPGWTIYLDDTTIIEKVASGIAKDLEGRVPEEQAKLRKVYEWWGIPTNGKKALERVRCAERLGAVLDGGRGILRTSTKRGLDLFSLGTWIRSEPTVSTKALQIYAGKAVHILQFRRCLFSVLQEIFGVIAKGGEHHRLTRGVVDEMLILESLIPLVQFNLKARIDGTVTASDACESGGGACFASRLSRLGEEELREMMEEGKVESLEGIPSFQQERERVIVIDLFAGIGGLEVALRKIDIKVVLVVASEIDPDCKRLLRRKYPGIELVGDIRNLTPERLRKLVKKVPNATGIIAGGGSPCQGLSRLSAERLHLEDERSKLFYDAADVLEEVGKVGREEGLWVLKLLENVVADESDVREMSNVLNMRPVLVDAAFLSRARRPRLYWLSTTLIKLEGVEHNELPEMEELKYVGPMERMTDVLAPGWTWQAGERDETLRFPTFTRPIKRRQPPKEPAGIQNSSHLAKERWREHEFRYPPYTYERKYMVEGPESRVRILRAQEREVLMGFEKDYTKDLARKEPESRSDQRDLEDRRCAALGNSFHTLALGCLLDHALWSLGVKPLKGHPLIIEEERRRQKKMSSKEEPSVTASKDEAGSMGLCDGSETEAEVVALEQVVSTIAPRKPLSDVPTPHDCRMAIQMVGAFIRRQEYRGSDVRLDVGTLYRPECFPRATVNPHRWLWHVAHAYKFSLEEHINVLELRAILHCLEWRARHSGFGDCRCLHLSDSQVALSVSVKGRSSSRKLNRVLQKLAALEVACGVFPVMAWVESHLNPADEPSRRYEPKG